MESIILKLKPKSQIQKTPEWKKHGFNQKRVVQDIDNDIWICNDSRNQFGNLEFYQHQLQQQEQIQQQQQLQQMREQYVQRLQQMREEQTRGDLRACYNCHQDGHIARVCPEPRHERPSLILEQSETNGTRARGRRRGRGGRGRGRGRQGNQSN